MSDGLPPPRLTGRFRRQEYLDPEREARASIEQLRRGEETRIYFSPISDQVEALIRREFQGERLEWGRIDDICKTVRLERPADAFDEWRWFDK